MAVEAVIKVERLAPVVKAFNVVKLIRWWLWTTERREDPANEAYKSLKKVETNSNSIMEAPIVKSVLTNHKTEVFNKNY